MQHPTPRIAIVGAGASGILLAGALQAGRAPVDLVLIDPAPGRGVAYADRRPLHLLNTRVGNMSLERGSPEDFHRWLAAHAPRPEGRTADDFAPRALFGDYLEARLNRLQADGVRVVREAAQAAEATAEGWSVRLASRQRLAADVLVLATGWARPRPLLFHGRDEIEPVVQDDPWSGGAVERLGSGAQVLLVGTGLTALDVAVSAWGQAPDCRVFAVSRHGMLPRVHASPTAAAPALSPPYPTTARELYAKLRAAAEFVEGDGSLRHGVFLGLRNVAAEIWAGLPLSERLIFLRHFRRYWDVERHRVPPAQAEAVSAAAAAGRFTVLRGRLAEVHELAGGAARVSVSTRDGLKPLEVQALVNCTGPEQDPFRSRNPVILDLLAQGRASADPLGLGLKVDDDCAVIGEGGRPTSGLFAIGPPTQGQFFEVTAVPEIRLQAERLAARLGASARARPAPQLSSVAGG